MIINTINKKIFSRQYIWFYNNEPLKLLNNNIFVHSHVLPESIKAVNLEKVYTSVIDISVSIDSITANFKTKLRGYINKGKRTEFEYIIVDLTLASNQNKIINNYNLFATKKGISLLNTNLFISYCNSGFMEATQIMFDNIPIAMHVYLKEKERVVLSYSFHLPNLEKFDGQFIGLANRYLHFLDILNYKEKGYLKYDLGGLTNDESSLRDFKLSFGGYVEENYGYVINKGLYEYLYIFKKSLSFLKRNK
jgi:hypothetical protein